MKNRDDIGVGFIVGTLAGGLLIGGMMLPKPEETLAYIKLYVDIIAPFATAALAASIAYIGNKIAKGNTTRDKYRNNWEILTAWREMYKWLSIEETMPISFLKIERKIIILLKSYMVLSEDTEQPPEVVKGGLLNFKLDDLSKILQELKSSYAETISKIQQLQSNCTSFDLVTKKFFKIEFDWDIFIKEANLVKAELDELNSVLDRCNKLRHGINDAIQRSEADGEEPYTSVIVHLRRHKELDSPLTFEEIQKLGTKIESTSKRYSDLCFKMNSHYQSFCPDL